MSDKIRVDGISDLMKAMDEFPGKLERSILRGGMRAGAKIILQEAASRIRSFSGELAESGRLSTSNKNGIVEAKITFGSRVKGGSRNARGERGAFYAGMVEFGTATHVIKAAKAKALKIGNRFVTSVQHPGAKPQPFFRPAISVKLNEAGETLVGYVRARVDRLNEEADEE